MTEGGFFTILDSVESSNNYAMQQVHEGLATHGMAWFATEQTAGKGQRGKSWTSEKGKNIVMSLVLEPGQFSEEPHGKTTNQFHLSAAIALSCYELLKMYAGDEIKIKWPNDLYWRDRKAGGILIENKFQGKAWKWAIVGIGINVNQTKFNNLINPVSLKQITGKTFNVIDLAKELHSLLMKNFAVGRTPDEIIQQYNEQLYKINQLVTLRKEGIKFDTVIKGVTAQGKLVTVDAIEREFDFGEVEWVL
jgi:BirA family biotin operon repressor/biotin-[acetyl-CoA-carboxylase] ligase